MHSSSLYLTLLLWLSILLSNATFAQTKPLEVSSIPDSLNIETSNEYLEVVLKSASWPSFDFLPYAIDSTLIEKDNLQSTENLELKEDSSLANKELNIEYEFNIQPLRSSNNNSNTFVFYLLIISLILVAFVRHVDLMYLKQLYGSFGNFNLSRQFFKDLKGNDSFTRVLLNFNVLLVLSIFVFLVLRTLNVHSQLPAPIFFVIIFLAVCFCIIGKQLLLRLVSSILKPVSQIILFYIFNLKAINVMLSFALLPCLFFVAFGQHYLMYFGLIIGFSIIVLMFVYRVQRSLFVGKDLLRDYKFHFFIYLCTLEIAPVLVIGKALSLIL